MAQVYVLDVVGGGEARRITSAPLAARAPRWSPDGKKVLYQSASYPGAADADANKKIAGERKDAKSKVRIYDTFPIRRWDKWLDDTQSRLLVIAADGEGPARDLLSGTALAQPGSARPPTKARARTSRRSGRRTGPRSSSSPPPIARPRPMRT